mmetsp:Transcript_48791/g.139584  ORF Transcript_48791/g.139584 Transcript_48791/m.139584 type:complete len:218 (-) Transcript_48791:634-1287(-)
MRWLLRTVSKCAQQRSGGRSGADMVHGPRSRERIEGPRANSAAASGIASMFPRLLPPCRSFLPPEAFCGWSRTSLALKGRLARELSGQPIQSSGPPPACFAAWAARWRSSGGVAEACPSISMAVACFCSRPQTSARRSFRPSRAPWTSSRTACSSLYRNSSACSTALKRPSKSWRSCLSMSSSSFSASEPLSSTALCALEETALEASLVMLAGVNTG